MKGFGSITPNTGGRDNVRIEQLVEVVKLSKEALDWYTVRFLPNSMLPVRTHWIKILTGKDKKEVEIPKLCVAFDPETEENKEDVKCPYCELSTGEGGVMRTDTRYYVNAICRDIEEAKPGNYRKPSSKEKKSGIIEMGSKTWTPVRVLPITTGLAQKIQKIAGRNKYKGEAYPVDHAKHGMDISIQFDPNSKSPSNYYTIDRGDQNELSKKEKAYLKWDINEDIIDKMGRETEDEAIKAFKKLDIVGSDQVDSDESDDSDDDNTGMKLKSKKSSKKDKKKKSKKSAIDLSESDEDSDEDMKLKSKKSSKKSKSSSKDKKSKSSSKDKKSKSSKDKDKKSKSSSKDKKSKDKKSSKKKKK